MKKNGTTKNGENHAQCPTGIPGLDDVLLGGIPRNHLYLLQGKPGTGKTTFAMQFLLEGARLGESVLYVTFSETKAELEAVAKSHGWDLSAIKILELTTIFESIQKTSQNTLFHPSEVELNNVIALLLEEIEAAKASRIVLDSVSELRLLAETSLRYRRQMLAFKRYFIGKGSTVIFLDDMTTEAGDLQVQSIVHGVMLLEKTRAGYGVERREFHIAKLRGLAFRAGTHDYIIRKGGIQIFPRLVAAEHSSDSFKPEVLSTGNKELDALLGGGLDRGTSNLILGPAGTGKSTIAVAIAVAAAAQGKKVVFYSFEESRTNLLRRTEGIGIPLAKYVDSGAIDLRKVDPAELTPGQFAALVRNANEGEVDLVVVDSLNGYIHAMPEQQFLILQLHELLSYLGNRGTVTLFVLSQAGLMGTMQSPLDLTYLADCVILTRYFEAFGCIRKAVSIVKKRSGYHEDTLREFQIGKSGLKIGKTLEEFSGIFTGTPEFTGTKGKMMKAGRARSK